MTYIIEKGVPMPPQKRNTKRPWSDSINAYLRRMELGDSILTPHCDYATNRQAMSRVGSKGKCFEGRTLDEGYRIWRTA